MKTLESFDKSSNRMAAHLPSLRLRTTKALAVICLFVVPASLPAAIIFEENFTAQGAATTGGSMTFTASQAGGTIGLLSTTTMGSGNYLEIDRTAASTMAGPTMAPTSNANSWSAMDTIGTAGAGTNNSLNGGFDFFYRVNSAATPTANGWFKPIDIGGTGTGMRMIFSNTNGTTLQVRFLGSASAFTNSSSALTNIIDLNATYSFASISAINHLGVTFSTDNLTGIVTAKLFGTASGGAIDTNSGTHLLGTTTFKIMTNVVSAGLPTGTWLFGTSGSGAGLNNTDYDSLRLYDSNPAAFAAIPEPKTMVLVTIGLMFIMLRRRRKRA